MTIRSVMPPKSVFDLSHLPKKRPPEKKRSKSKTVVKSQPRGNEDYVPKNYGWN